MRFPPQVDESFIKVSSLSSSELTFGEVILLLLRGGLLISEIHSHFLSCQHLLSGPEILPVHREVLLKDTEQFWTSDERSFRQITMKLPEPTHALNRVSLFHFKDSVGFLLAEPSWILLFYSHPH